MELRDYRDMYDRMRMSGEMDERIKSAVLKHQERKDYHMKKFNVKKTVVAAALCGIVLAGGVSAYAAVSGNFSLLSMFAGESSEVKNNAVNLIDTEVAQEKVNNTGAPQTKAVNKKQSDLVSFDITEAICDKNNVVIQVEAKARDHEKYLLVTPECKPDIDPVSDLNIRGVKADKKMTVAEYAKSLGKKCLKVSANVECGARSESISNYMKSDGTMVYTIHFENVEKQKKLDYVCETAVFPADKKDYSDDDIINQINFTLTDKSDVETVKYLPVSNGEIEGTNMVVDEVTFDKSSLSMVCNVKYHYAGNDKNWRYNSKKDEGIVFYMLNKNGEMVEVSHSGYGGKTEINGKTVVQSESFSLTDLPDTITFEVKNLYESDENGKKSYGKFDVKLAK